MHLSLVVAVREHSGVLFARRDYSFHRAETGIVGSVCCALGEGATSKSDRDKDFRFVLTGIHGKKVC